ncbi:MAG: hypothetical protein ACXVCY_11410 [Pseudobdellovibrionaceae bacterium]
MTAQNDCNYVQKIFYIIFRKYLPNWSDVVSFSNRTGISQNTLRDIYYKDGQAGIATMDRVLKELLELTPEKVDSIVHRIHVLEPIPESSRIWNSINVPESRKRYYALVAKALSEIDEKLESKNSN